MQPNLVGYVLNILDPREQAEVEEYLRAHPAARGEVEKLRKSIEPLPLDATESPPAGLVARTMASVADQVDGVPAPSWRLRGMGWRRIAEVAAVLLLTITAVGMGLSWLGRLHLQSDVVSCQDNLREIFVMLRAYGDGHQGQLPHVATAAEPPRNVGGLVFAMLRDQDLLPGNVKVSCPATGGPTPTPVSLADVKAMSEPAFDLWARGLQSGYAYALGYRQADQLQGLRLDDSKPSSLMPLMADSSPVDPLGGLQSVNHGGNGQNVLFCDGHVTFCPTRFVGYERDDIYLSRDRKVSAGVDWTDTVLSSGAYLP
jgi:prepilin-type processing-associated H-X9-DG protein